MLLKPSNQPLDLLVIGGGIQGAGIARDAALRGLQVGLFEKEDFACATSSNSSKLIHGGLRYLENLELSLVNESLRERTILLKTARHLVHPLGLWIPLFGKSRRSPWMFRLGLILYDLLAGKQPMPSHSALNRAEARKHLPFLKPDGMRGGLRFYDGQTDDTRLALANILEARQAGAQCFNHASVEHLACRPDQTFTARIRHGGKNTEIQARTVVNAAGPWVDQLLAHMAPQGDRLIRWAKGIHILLRAGLDLKEGLLLQVPGEKRIFFVLPWGRLALVGTTDTPYKGSLEEVTVTQEDITYLLKCLQHYFTDQALAGCRIVGTYAGVRPLTYVKGRTTRQLSRDYRIHEFPRNCWSIIGGKYTVYRRIAEKVVDRVANRLGIWKECTTQNQPLIGHPEQEWDAFVQEATTQAVSEFHLNEKSARHLIFRHGTAWVDVIRLAQGDPTLLEPLSPLHPHLRVEVVHAMEREQAVTLEDLLVRRLNLWHSEDGGLSALDSVVEVLQEKLQYPSERLEGEKRQYLEKYHTWQRTLESWQECSEKKP